MKKDKFTRKELVEFALGAILSLFLAYSVLVAMNNFVTVERSILLFVFTISLSIISLHLIKVPNMINRFLCAFGISAGVTTIYLILVLNVFPDNPMFLTLFPITLGVSIIGALTLDMLRGD